MRRSKDEDRKLARQLGHFKRLRKVAGLLSFLHSVGCVRDKAHNRELHFDDYVLLVLLWMFTSLLEVLLATEYRRNAGDASERISPAYLLQQSRILESANRRYLAAIRELARVRKLRAG